MKRRLFLGLAGGALCSCGEKSSGHSWKGIVFGIPVGIRFLNVTERIAEDLGQQSLQLAQKYEACFSLWDENSELSLLNREGALPSPSEGLLDCLKIAKDFHTKSNGLFDPTIHSYLEWSKGEYAAGRIPDALEAERRRKLVNFSRVEISEDLIKLEPGMSLSLNALVQGYVTDRVCEFLEEHVLAALVNFGEYRVVGSHPFDVEVEGQTMLIRHALAVSSGGGQRLSATASANHLINPRDGVSPDPRRVIAIETRKAVNADAIATIVALGGEVPEGCGTVRTWEF